MRSYMTSNGFCGARQRYSAVSLFCMGLLPSGVAVISKLKALQERFYRLNWQFASKKKKSKK